MSDHDHAGQEEILFLSEFSNELIARHDRHGKFLSVSAAAPRLIGYTQDELIGKFIFDFVHPEDAGSFRDLFASFVPPLAQIMIRYRFRLKTGEYTWLETAYHRRNESIFSVSTDVSKRIAALDALKDTESSFNAFFNGSACPHGIVEICGEDLIHVATNTAAEKFFERPSNVLLGRLKPSVIFTTDHIKTLITHYKRSEVLSEPVTFEFNYQRSDGTRSLSITVNYIGRNSEGVKRYSYYVIDITESVQSRMQSTQVSKMASLGEMAAGISHEINNPLTVIKANAYHIKHRLSQGRLDDGVLNRAIGAIDQTTDRIAQIIRGLRVFARESTGDPFMDTSVQVIVEDTLSLCQARIKNAGIRLEITNGVGALKIACRAAEISQILVNLLNNAVDAVLGKKDPWIRINLCKTSRHFELIVTDSGLGIEERIRDKIMQPFFTTKEVGKGVGLGLSISQGLADLHDGRLFLDSTSDNTRFVLELPLLVDAFEAPVFTTDPVSYATLETLY